VNVWIEVKHYCNSVSCLGCRTLLLQNLCNAAQSCAIVKCIGTVVNQNRPLCNIGLALQNAAQQAFSLIVASWLILTNTYTKILRVSLSNVEQVDVEWLDDAFFGYVCTAKDLGKLTHTPCLADT
jgi:hypothetical protein